MVKLLMGWDIKRGVDAEYFEFVIRDFAPTLTQLGMLPSEAWFTIYGEGPQVLAGAVAQDLDTMQDIMQTAGWRELKTRLLEYVTNYRERIVEPTGTLQIF